MPSKIIYAIFFALCGCVSNASDMQPSKLASDFYTKYISTSEQIKQFKNYSLEEQYEIFEFGNQVVHPPAIYLAYPFAQQGAAIIPFLRKKLETEKDEARIRDIALIFARVAGLKLYDFSKDIELMSLLNQKVNNMQGMWKGVTLKFLSEIQSGKSAQ
jgi:hypothetical protein